MRRPSGKKAPSIQELAAENEALQLRLEEAEGTLQAIRSGEVDALLVESPEGEQVFTLKGADYQYRVIVENMYEGAALLDTGGSLVYCNKRLALMLKRPFEQLIGCPFAEFVNGSDRAGFESLLDRSRPENVRMETILAGADRAAIPVHISAVDVSFQGIPQTCLIVTDSSDIIASEKKYREIVETSLEGIATLDTDANITFVNERMAEMLDYNAGDVMGRSVYELVYDPDIPEARTRFRRHRNGEIQRIDIRLKKKDGSFIWALISSRSLYDEYGNFAGVLGMVTDVTKRKEAEELILKTNERLEARVAERTSQLEAANRELESFSYSISHDLRAPLRIISSMSEILLKDYSDNLDDEGRTLLNSVVGNARRMDELIKAVLDLSRISSREVSMSKINMHNTVSRVVDELRAVLPERKIDVVIKDLPVARGDRTLIRQVFANLLSNAFKFTGGRKVAHIEVGGSREGDETIYYIRDNGAGFDMNYADKLFKAFQRLHTSREFEGIGIGLSIVYRIISRHGGRLWAEGKENEGATFYFTLPADR